MDSREGLPVTLPVGNDATAEMLTRIELDELEKLARTYVGEHYDGDETIDWEQLWEDLDGATLPSGLILRVTSSDSPLHRHIRTMIEEL